MLSRTNEERTNQNSQTGKKRTITRTITRTMLPQNSLLTSKSSSFNSTVVGGLSKRITQNMSQSASALSTMTMNPSYDEESPHSTHPLKSTNTTRIKSKDNDRKMSMSEKGIPSNLTEKLIGDVLVATSVTLGVAPFLAVVDKAIVQRAAGTHSVFASSAETLRSIVRNPIQYVKSPMFLMMWGVYASTYTTANCLKTIVEHRQHFSSDDKGIKSSARDEMSHDNSNNDTNKEWMGKAGIFAGTTLVNSITSLMKDRAYATMFSTSGAATKVPLMSYGLWSIRDCTVIGSSFILPDIMSQTLQTSMNVNATDASRISQLACPITAQLIAGPIQLLGLDYYNRPMSDIPFQQAAMERWRLLVRNYFSVVSARIARIAPAYGMGGIGNTYFRDLWRTMLVQREESPMMSTTTTTTTTTILKSRNTEGEVNQNNVSSSLFGVNKEVERPSTEYWYEYLKEGQNLEM